MTRSGFSRSGACLNLRDYPVASDKFFMHEADMTQWMRQCFAPKVSVFFPRLMVSSDQTQSAGLCLAFVRTTFGAILLWVALIIDSNSFCRGMKGSESSRMYFGSEKDTPSVFAYLA